MSTPVRFSGTVAASNVADASGLQVAPAASVTGATFDTTSAVLPSVSQVLSSISSAVSSGAQAGSTAAAAGASSGGGGGRKSFLSPDEETAMEAESTTFSHWLFLSMSFIAFIVIIYRVVVLFQSHLRHITSINDKVQAYWARPATPFFSKMKKNFLLAPLFGVRHNEHFKIGSAGGAGIVPTRFQALFLIILLALNVGLTVGSVHWSRSKGVILSELRNRSGVLAVTNMVPLFLLAGRNNPLIPMLRISFDTYNLIHRWLGRIVVLEALTHTISHILNKNWSSFMVSLQKSEMILTGTISTLAMVFLFVQSPSIIRHAFYESFLTLHIIGAIVAVVTLYFHLDLIDNKWLRYLQVAIGIWVAERVARFVSIIYRNVGRSVTKATITALSTEAARVTLDMPRPFRFRPGQHVYLYLPTITGLQSHPFSVAWADETAPLVWNPDTKEELPRNRQDVYGPQKTTVELIVRRRTGATDKIFRKAAEAAEGSVTVRALVEGPYGTYQSLSSYGTVVLFAGGVGITHQLPNVLELVQGYIDGTIATRKVVLVWVLQNPEHLQWVKRQMTSILAMEKRREVLKVTLFVTKPKQSREIMSPSSTVQMFPGKPNIEQLLQGELEERVGTMAVSVCGPGSMSDDVRDAVRGLVDYVNIDFIEEAFSW
ncbi:Ferric/cupric reductase transmembrane component [Drechslerella dactyloides]|uniref:ferric-chelate reductase (NADPH) n=1 Tax=Drechslerella dactyloides TaxID=74499 RepID=A0AAD6NJL0_DREDA|nr:Ferric/cupric reductase transmembrane component [Drechslerella dactyloides]